MIRYARDLPKYPTLNGLECDDPLVIAANAELAHLVHAELHRINYGKDPPSIMERWSRAVAMVSDALRMKMPRSNPEGELEDIQEYICRMAWQAAVVQSDSNVEILDQPTGDFKASEVALGSSAVMVSHEVEPRKWESPLILVSLYGSASSNPDKDGAGESRHIASALRRTDQQPAIAITSTSLTDSFLASVKKNMLPVCRMGAGQLQKMRRVVSYSAVAQGKSTPQLRQCYVCGEVCPHKWSVLSTLMLQGPYGRAKCPGCGAKTDWVLEPTKDGCILGTARAAETRRWGSGSLLLVQSPQEASAVTVILRGQTSKRLVGVLAKAIRIARKLLHRLSFLSHLSISCDESIHEIPLCYPSRAMQIHEVPGSDGPPVLRLPSGGVLDISEVAFDDLTPKPGTLGSTIIDLLDKALLTRRPPKCNYYFYGGQRVAVKVTSTARQESQSEDSESSSRHDRDDGDERSLERPSESRTREARKTVPISEKDLLAVVACRKCKKEVRCKETPSTRGLLSNDCSQMMRDVVHFLLSTQGGEYKQSCGHNLRDSKIVIGCVADGDEPYPQISVTIDAVNVYKLSLPSEHLVFDAEVVSATREREHAEFLDAVQEGYDGIEQILVRGKHPETPADDSPRSFEAATPACSPGFSSLASCLMYPVGDVKSADEEEAMDATFISSQSAELLENYCPSNVSVASTGRAATMLARSVVEGARSCSMERETRSVLPGEGMVTASTLSATKATTPDSMTTSVEVRLSRPCLSPLGVCTQLSSSGGRRPSLAPSPLVHTIADLLTCLRKQREALIAAAGQVMAKYQPSDVGAISELNGLKRDFQLRLSEWLGTLHSAGEALAVKIPKNLRHVPIPETERPTLDVLVRPEEPTSIIAHALCSQYHQQALVEMTKCLDRGTKKELRADLQVGKWDSEGALHILENDKLKRSTLKINVNVADGENTIAFSCSILCALQFAALRHLLCKGDESNFLISLSRCIAFAPSGGKSGAHFTRTLDQRLVAKEITSSKQLEHFERIAGIYFNHVARSLRGQASALVKILGVFRVEVGGTSRVWAVQENMLSGVDNTIPASPVTPLRYRTPYAAIYDIKGATRQRIAQPNSSVLLDGDMLTSLRRGCGLFVDPESANLLFEAIKRDTAMLSTEHIMDYSLLVTTDGPSKVRVGIIDYLQEFTIAKQMESFIKYYCAVRATEPSVVNPEKYKDRFCEAVRVFLAPVPNDT